MTPQQRLAALALLRVQQAEEYLEQATNNARDVNDEQGHSSFDYAEADSVVYRAQRALEEAREYLRLKQVAVSRESVCAD